MKFLPLILATVSMGQRILKRDIGALTFNGSALTTNNRNPPMKQLQCIGGDACNLGFNPDLLKCANIGWDGIESQWLCSGEVDESVRLGETRVNCEGYKYDKDPKVLIGSCYLSYALHKTSKYQTSPMETVKSFASSILNSELYLNNIMKKALGNGDEEPEFESIEDTSEVKSQEEDYPHNFYEFLVMATDLFDTFTAKIIHLILESSQIYVLLAQTLLSGVVMIIVVFGSTIIMMMTTYFLVCSVLTSIFASEGLFATVYPRVFSPKATVQDKQTESECSDGTLFDKDLAAAFKLDNPSLEKTANELRIRNKARSMLKEFRQASKSIVERAKSTVASIETRYTSNSIQLINSTPEVIENLSKDKSNENEAVVEEEILNEASKSIMDEKVIRDDQPTHIENIKSTEIKVIQPLKKNSAKSKIVSPVGANSTDMYLPAVRKSIRRKSNTALDIMSDLKKIKTEPQGDSKTTELSVELVESNLIEPRKEVTKDQVSAIIANENVTKLVLQTDSETTITTEIPEDGSKSENEKGIGSVMNVNPTNVLPQSQAPEVKEPKVMPSVPSILDPENVFSSNSLEKMIEKDHEIEIPEDVFDTIPIHDLKKSKSQASLTSDDYVRVKGAEY